MKNNNLVFDLQVLSFTQKRKADAKPGHKMKTPTKSSYLYLERNQGIIKTWKIDDFFYALRLFSVELWKNHAECTFRNISEWPCLNQKDRSMSCSKTVLLWNCRKVRVCPWDIDLNCKSCMSRHFRICNLNDQSVILEIGTAY